MKADPSSLRARARDGHSGIMVAHSAVALRGAPFVRVVAGNGRILAHSETYSDGHEARAGAEVLERAVIAHSHRSGAALYDVLLEMDRQDAKWGDQSHHPDGTGPDSYPLWGLGITGRVSPASDLRDRAVGVTGQLAYSDELTWWNIALEEFFEAAAEEPESDELRRELIQAAAVLVQWAAAIDRRGGESS